MKRAPLALVRPADAVNSPARDGAGLRRGIHWATFGDFGVGFFAVGRDGRMLAGVEWERKWPDRDELIVWLADEPDGRDPPIRLVAT